MADFRDNFDTHPTLAYRGKAENSWIGPFIALVVIAVLIASIFFMTRNTGNIEMSANPAAATQTTPSTTVGEPLAPGPTTAQ